MTQPRRALDAAGTDMGTGIVPEQAVHKWGIARIGWVGCMHSWYLGSEQGMTLLTAPREMRKACTRGTGRHLPTDVCRYIGR